MTEQNKAQDTASEQVSKSTQSTPVNHVEVKKVENNNTVTQTQESNTATDTAPNTSLSEEDIKQKLEKVRSDEKAKLYSQMESMKTEKSKLEETVNKLQDSLKETTNNLDVLRKGESTKIDSITEELAKLREQNATLAEQIVSVAENAEATVKASELKLYKEKAIMESNINLVELVNGDSKEAIDASIKKIQEREQVMRESMLKELEKQSSSNLPKPLAPSAQHGLVAQNFITPTDRQSLAKLPAKQYQQARAERLALAKQKVGF